jgi:hypothetical protein
MSAWPMRGDSPAAHASGMTSPTSSPSTSAPALGPAEEAVRALAVPVVLGSLLGLWCRSWTLGSGGAAGAVLADLGAPWILAAFAVGVLVVTPRPGRPAVEVAGVALAGMAGAATLALASFVYYDGSIGPRAVLWAAIGLVVGSLAATAGATWRLRPESAVGVMAAGALGLTFAAEGVARLSGGLWMDAGPVARVTVLAVTAAGVATPLILARGRAAGLVASLAVVVLALPVALLLVTAPALTYL